MTFLEHRRAYMCSYRDELPDDETRARFDKAAAGFAQIFVDACHEQARIVAGQGPRVAAELVFYKGHPLGSLEAVQAAIEAVHAAPRLRRGRGME